MGISLKIFVLPNGLKCIVDAKQKFIKFDHLFTSFGEIFENKEYLLLKEYKPRSGDVVFDVEAFIGLYTLFVSKCIGENGKVYALSRCLFPIDFYLKT